MGDLWYKQDKIVLRTVMFLLLEKKRREHYSFTFKLVLEHNLSNFPPYEPLNEVKFT